MAPEPEEKEDEEVEAGEAGGEAGEAKKKKKNKKKKAAAGDGAAAEETPAAAAPEAEGGEDKEEAEEEGGAEGGAAGAAKKKKKKKKAAAAGDAAAEEAPAAPAAAGGDGEADEGEETANAAPGKKTRRGGKKKAAAGEEGGADGKPAKSRGFFALPEQDNSVFRRLGNWKALAKTRQSPDVDVPVAEQYPEADYPLGEVCEYTGTNAFRTTSAEKRDLERLTGYDYEKIRRAAECHRQVRKYAQSYVRPGIAMTDFCQRLERKTHELIAANGLECGWGFPTGCSLNYVAAHYTPNYGDNTILQQDDVCKLDFGVQVGGRIVDCAFTIAFNPRYDSIIEASQEGTNTGLKEAGIDARFSDIGAAIQESIESYELEINGKTYPVKAVKNLNGHSIGPYQIHGGKSVPITKNNESTKMEENEFYAIETFASSGKGYVVEDLDCSHYMKIFDAPHIPLRVKSSKALLYSIEQNFGTLAFCRRWLDDIGQTRHLMALKNLVDNDLVQPYPPLCDSKGSYVTQMEHTVLLRPTCKEIVSRGDDF